MSARKKKSEDGKRRASSVKFLGEVFAEIAGKQYYEAEVHPGEKVQLEREPDNRHDENAIRVENRKFLQAGYVPRRISSWLAPLIDSGEVWVEAHVAESSRPGKAEKPYILLELYLHRKGRHILQRETDPENVVEGLHQAVLATWCEIDNWTDGDIVSVLADRLRAFSKEDLLPETRMLLDLFKYRAWVLRRRVEEEVIEEVRNTLEGLKIGKSLFYHNLTIFPLLSENGHKKDYLLLKDAIAKKQAEVREVSEAGSIPELMVENRAPLPILIPEGEVLIGAKQNRTVNITMLIREGAEQVIPVSCVEQNRWSWRSPTLAVSHYATPGLRGRKVASSLKSRRRTGRAVSDQSQVWEDVAMSINAAGADSETGSITDALEKAKKRTMEYRNKLVLPKNAAGVLCVSGEEILGMDLFDSPKTLRKIWPRLSESYFFEAAVREKKGKTLKKTASDFMKALTEIIQLSREDLGYGRELELSDKGYAGSGLWYNGRLCHLSAFRVRQND